MSGSCSAHLQVGIFPLRTMPTGRLALHPVGGARTRCSGVRRQRGNAVVATVRGVDKKLRLVDQVAGRVPRVGFVRFLVRGKKVMGEFAAGKRIEEFLRVVEARAKFLDDLRRDRPRCWNDSIFTSPFAARSMDR